MKAFIRENPTIAFGLGLPILLVVVFLLVSGIPALLVDPPKYDVLYTTDYYNSADSLQIAVVGKQAQVTYRANPNRNYNQFPRLWRYYAKTGAVQEIVIPLPSEGVALPEPRTLGPPVILNVPDLDSLTVDSASIAPDGYEFNVSGRYSRGVFGGLFYSSRNRDHARLSKDGRSIRIPNADNAYYRQQPRFVGWVTAP
jgi:hypothetical protein